MGDYEKHIAHDAEWIGQGQKLGAESLDAFLERNKRLAVAFSGGCDSSYLLAAAYEAGCDVRAYLVRTAFQPSFELEDACAVANRLVVPFKILDVDMLSREEVCTNTVERCYLCKRVIFSEIRKAAREDGIDIVVDGTNASDDPSRRPGFRALGECGVLSPLRMAGMTKADVRDALRRLEARLGFASGELMSDKPSFPCLAVFVGEGKRITEESLAEAALARGL